MIARSESAAFEFHEIAQGVILTRAPAPVKYRQLCGFWSARRAFLYPKLPRLYRCGGTNFRRYLIVRVVLQRLSSCVFLLLIESPPNSTPPIQPEPLPFPAHVVDFCLWSHLPVHIACAGGCSHLAPGWPPPNWPSSLLKFHNKSLPHLTINEGISIRTEETMNSGALSAEDEWDASSGRPGVEEGWSGVRWGWE